MERADTAISLDARLDPWHAILSGLSAILVGIGLARFAYTPLIPALIAADWFSASAVVYLGAANLAGYLAGALFARWMAARTTSARLLRAMMLLASASFFASAVPLSFLWFFVWRFLSGVTGGVLMVLAASNVLPHIPPSRRGFAGGVIFTGVGLGIVASGTLLPLLLRLGLVETWCALGALALLLTILSWGGWQEDVAAPALLPHDVRPRQRSTALMALYVEYALNAVGLVPHMVFLVDFIARGLGRGVDAGAQYWVLFGLGALLGPIAAGRAADRIGFKRALRVAFLLQVLAVALLAVTANTISLVISSVAVGALMPGIVSLVLGRVHELSPQDMPGQRRAWSRATAAFALGQAGAAYGFSFLFAAGASYPRLFGLGASAVLAALAIDLAVSMPSSRQSRR